MAVRFVHLFLDPTKLTLELIYTAIIVTLCFIIYYRTKEIYALTRHKGIHFFRTSFLLFGLAWLSRFFLYMLLISTLQFDIFLPRNVFTPIAMIPTGFLSTLALFYLVYSLVWRRLRSETFHTISAVMAMLFTLIAFVTHSMRLISILQISLMVLALFYIWQSKARERKKKKGMDAKTIYALTILLWVINLFFIRGRGMVIPGLKYFFEIASIVIFIMILRKVMKWTK